MNKHGEFLYIQGDLAGFPVGIKFSVIKSSRLYRVVFAHSHNTDASLGPSLGSSRERFGQQLPALTAADQRYTSYTQRVSIDRSRNVRIPRDSYGRNILAQQSSVGIGFFTYSQDTDASLQIVNE